ncbi:hypothetical protein TNCV_1427301 [Trichonephila clavipes]|nr:hypothetical protein TNCV_1427301 [Trichonephila clavipes]
MVLPGKVRGELIKLYYQNGMNAAEALRVYHRNHRQRRGPGTLQALRDLVRKFEDTGCTCNKPRSGRPTVSEDVVMEVHHTVTAGHTETARGIARVLDIRTQRSASSCALYFTCFPIGSSASRCWSRVTHNNVWTSQINFCYDMMRITTGHFAYYGRTRRISP